MTRKPHRRNFPLVFTQPQLQDGGDLGERRALRQDDEGALRGRDLHKRRKDLQHVSQVWPHSRTIT